jgi:mRNA-degrading endonuclease toxin of MazEF toxin-antitoxin module
MALPTPRRGEIWTASLRHWVLVVSLDARNLSERVDTVLVLPFGSRGMQGSTVLMLPPGETGLPGISYLKAHLITTLPKAKLIARVPRLLTRSRMREVVTVIQRAIDPDAPYQPQK